MLGYKNYLQQSRARRGYTDLPIHYEIPDPRSNQDIKQLASNPNFGQIFYSDGNHPPEKLNTHLKSSLKTEVGKNEELVAYMRHLEEENAMLKGHLAQVMGGHQGQTQGQGQQGYAIQNLNGNINNRTVYGVDGYGYGEDDGGYEPNDGQNRERQYITSMVPSQNYINQQPIYPIQHQQQHIPQFSFTGPQPQRTQQQPQPRATLPANPTPSTNSLYQPNLPYPQQEPPIIPQQISTQYHLSQQQIYSPYNNIQNNLNQNSNLRMRAQSMPYQNQRTSQEQIGDDGRREIIMMAKHKLNQIKDDDEELRAYTIKLLSRPA